MFVTVATPLTLMNISVCLYSVSLIQTKTDSDDMIGHSSDDRRIFCVIDQEKRSYQDQKCLVFNEAVI